MARTTAADKAADDARVAILYTLNAAREDRRTLTLAELRDSNEALSIDKLDDDALDAVVAELVAEGTIAEDDGHYLVPDADAPDGGHLTDAYEDDGDRVVLPTVPLRDGFGYLVIEAPLNVVAAYARLHEADRASMAQSAAGQLEQIMHEQGRMRGPLPADGAVALVVPGIEQ